jgi:hypothetical protein
MKKEEVINQIKSMRDTGIFWRKAIFFCIILLIIYSIIECFWSNSVIMSILIGSFCTSVIASTINNSKISEMMIFIVEKELEE